VKYKNVFDHPKKKSAMQVYGKDPASFDEFFEMTIALMNHELDGKATVVGLAMQVQYYDNISNSHSAPLIGVENFNRSQSGNKDLPTGYKGFSGRIWYRLSNSVSGFGSDVMRNALSYTGTGGGGAYNGPWQGISGRYYKAPSRLRRNLTSPELFSYDYKIFIDNFPAWRDGDANQVKLAEEFVVHKGKLYEYDKDKTFAIVNKSAWPSKPMPPIGPAYNREWTDPAQLKQDADFITELEMNDSRRILVTEKKLYEMGCV